MQTALETLGSAAFAATVVALLRKRWPALDGWYVTAIYAALAVAVALLTHYSAALPAEVWTVLQIAAGIVGTQGAITAAQQVAAKASVTNNTIAVTSSDPVIVEPDTSKTDPGASGE
ncbi:MAG: hypothetical protein WC683_09510 [bacterium]|jgi:hypothetical protein